MPTSSDSKKKKLVSSKEFMGLLGIKSSAIFYRLKSKEAYFPKELPRVNKNSLQFIESEAIDFAYYYNNRPEEITLKTKIKALWQQKVGVTEVVEQLDTTFAHAKSVFYALDNEALMQGELNVHDLMNLSLRKRGLYSGRIPGDKK